MELPILLTAVTIVLLLILSVPIAAALGLGVMVGMIAGDLPPEFMMQKVFSSLDSFPLLAVPFFILAGEIMQKGSMADALLRVSRCLVGHITGGMAHVSILTCMFYGALSGSSPATVAAVGGIMIPAMEKEGYPRDFSAAVNTSAGCLGVMIPPSVPLIIYGTTVGVSVSDLFIAGILPGIFVGIVLMFTAWALVRRRGINVATRRATRRETLRAVWEAKHALLVPVIVLGGIYGGLMTPTEAAAIAAMYGLLVGLFVYRELSLASLWKCCVESAQTSAVIIMLMAMATIFGNVMTLEQVPERIAAAILDLTSNKIAILLLINVLLLWVGTFMEALAAIVILTPILLPLVTKVGVDPIHFGVIMVVNLAIGFVTPPVGVNLFVACGITKQKIELVSRAAVPFILTMLVILLLVTYWPSLSLFLL